MEIFLKNPLFVGVRLPEVSKVVPLESRLPSLSPLAISWLKSCLVYEPDSRATTRDLMAHPYFQENQWADKFEVELKRTISLEREKEQVDRLRRKKSSSKRGDGSNHNLNNNPNSNGTAARSNMDKSHSSLKLVHTTSHHGSKRDNTENSSLGDGRKRGVEDERRMSKPIGSIPQPSSNKSYMYAGHQSHVKTQAGQHYNGMLPPVHGSNAAKRKDGLVFPKIGAKGAAQGNGLMGYGR